MVTRHLAPLILLLGLAAPAAAADAARGEALHQEHCTSCHTSLGGGDPNALYTRDQRRVKSLDGLRRQVQRCETSLGLRWFDEDVADVTAYLNARFYRFGQ